MAVWHRTSEPTAEPAAQIRRRGSTRAAIAAAAAGALWLYGSHGVAIGMSMLAGFLLVVALTSPTRAYLASERALLWVARGIGRVLTLVVMAALFFLFFTPFGRLRRRGASDRLHRQFDPEAQSYWEAPGFETSASKSLERQY